MIPGWGQGNPLSTLEVLLGQGLENVGAWVWEMEAGRQGRGTPQPLLSIAKFLFSLLPS